MRKSTALLLLLLPFLPACSSLSSHTEPKADLGGYHHVFVEKLLADGYGVDQIMARELRNMGYDATSGPLTMLPDNAEIIVAYYDRWTYDFTNYMIELDLIVRTARTDKRLATVYFHRPSLTGGSTLEMVDTALGKVFPAKPGNH
jgi:hypothetical protein